MIVSFCNQALIVLSKTRDTSVYFVENLKDFYRNKILRQKNRSNFYKNESNFLISKIHKKNKNIKFFQTTTAVPNRKFYIVWIHEVKRLI